ncbi:MAG: EAL domain-containing protein [Idiomarina sp.]|nr:EAL domain-containing protein [Idiomarina sp.]
MHIQKQAQNKKLGTHQPTAVLIDDDASSLLITSWLLKRQGYQIVTIQHLPDDLDNFIANPPLVVDVFVIDYCLENTNALQIISRLNTIPYFAKIPKVVVTSLRDDQIERHGLGGGAVEFITKPFNKQNFAQRVQLAHRKDLRVSYSPQSIIDELTQLSTVEGIAANAPHNALLQSEYSVVVIEIANLDKINNVRGRSIGNLTLKNMALRLQEFASNEVILLRTSNTRFAVISPTLTQSTLEEFQTRLTKLANRPISKGHQDVFVVLRTGVAHSSQGATHLEGVENRFRELLEATIANACLAVSLAKSKNKSEIELFSKSAKKELGRLHVLESAIYSGLVKQQLEVHYQPQVNIDTGELVGVEALARLQTPELGVVSPAELIPILEATNAIHEIGLHIFDIVFKDLATLKESVTVAVNVSAYQLKRGNFSKSILWMAKKHKVNPRRVEIEITETSALDMLGVSKQNLIDLASFGFKLTLDDFGIGYSNLDYLLALPIAKLKIDREFISRFPVDDSSRNIVKSLMYLAHLEGIQILAEGVETELQHNELRNIKVSLAQGFYYGKPMPLAVLHDRLQANTSNHSRLG